jgi:signal transduction histidine kinase
VNREFDAFAYTISHDLRAPLRAMQGYADALREDFGSVLPMEGQRYTERIMVCATRMEDLIEDILTYSRLSQSDINVCPVPLEGSIDRVLIDYSVTLAEKQAIVQISRPMPAVLASPAVLRQVLNNLVSNALKFMLPGARTTITMRTETVDDRVRLWIEDAGIGIHPDHHERIFEPFQRLHGVESYPGTGIGLAIVRRAVTRMGGRTGVISSPSEGSRFWIELPRSKDEASA